MRAWFMHVVNNVELSSRFTILSYNDEGDMDVDSLGPHHSKGIYDEEGTRRTRSNFPNIFFSFFHLSFFFFKTEFSLCNEQDTDDQLVSGTRA
uniref:Uncharacterized protein n=1 Tax=Vitis vinifera TaxID=29760 RepID=F6HTJ8_VITVI